MSDLDDLEEFSERFAARMTGRTDAELRREEQRRRGCVKGWARRQQRAISSSRAATKRRAFYGTPPNIEPRSPGRGERGS